MKKNAEAFLLKTLGGDFMESLGSTLSKSEIFKPGTRSITDTNDMFQGLQIVPRALLSLLVRELSPMQIGETKEIEIPGQEKTIVSTTKNERDQFSGQVFQNNVKINDFINRSIPGLGLVLMSVLQLYSMDELEKEPSIHSDQEKQINKLIDERIHLHSLINQVVDGKMMQKDAVNRLFLDKMTQLYKEHEKEKAEHERTRVQLAGTSSAALGYVKSGEVKPGDYGHSASFDDVMKLRQKIESKEESKPTAVIVLKPNKIRPLTEFIEKRKKKLDKKEFLVDICKSEAVECLDCGQTIFNDSGISACICYGNDMGRKVFLKKTENGIKLSFPKSWGTDNIIMLLETLRNKK